MALSLRDRRSQVPTCHPAKEFLHQEINLAVAAEEPVFTTDQVVDTQMSHQEEKFHLTSAPKHVPSHVQSHVQTGSVVVRL